MWQQERPPLPVPPQKPRPPLPRPPLPPPPQRATYGPSSSFLPRCDPEPLLPSRGIAPDTWIPYVQPTVGRGSTFFVGGSGTLGARRDARPLVLPLGYGGAAMGPARPSGPNFAAVADAPPPSPVTGWMPGGMRTPSSPRRLNPISERASSRAHGPTSPTLPTVTTKVPLASSSSILVHSGFWNILAATGSRFYGSPLALVDNDVDPVAGGARRAVTSPILGSEAVRKKRISVNMISKPAGFAHVLHASDAEQAEDLLRRWTQDGVGKLPQPSWVEPIKEAARARARARGIAQVHANREQPSTRRVLKVVNGGSVISSTGAEENVTVTHPLRDRTNSTGSIITRAESPSPTHDKRATSPTTVKITPSLATMERAIGARVFFETTYHSILKKESPRILRKAQLEDELSRIKMSESEKHSVRAAFVASETEHLRRVRNRVNVGSFVKLKTIGHGAFGVVSLVKEIGTGQVYAMKELRKAQMLLKGQEGHVRAERDLLEAASGTTRWIVRLLYSFQDRDHLYLVQEYMAGGDLLTLLIARDKFPEDFTRFYIAEMLLAIEETHDTLGSIHRDIKPDNFLLSAEGHIRVADFGLATDFHWSHDGAYYDQQRRDLLRKHGIDLEGNRAPPTERFDQGTYGFEENVPGSVLTMRDRNRRRLAYSYMAVEVLRGQGYDKSADWWSLGAILFECCYGYPPFVSDSRQVTRRKIINWRTSLSFPVKPKMSPECQHLIAALLCEPGDRLGATRPVTRAPNAVLVQNRTPPRPAPQALEGAAAIKAHPWFASIDFETLHLQTPPFVPQLRAASDTQYFEDNIDPNPLAAPDAGLGGLGGDSTKDPMLRVPELLEIRKQLAFQGWTYKSRDPSKQVYDPRRTGVRSFGATGADVPTRGRSTLRVQGGSGFGVRSLSV